MADIVGPCQETRSNCGSERSCRSPGSGACRNARTYGTFCPERVCAKDGVAFRTCRTDRNRATGRQAAAALPELPFIIPVRTKMARAKSRDPARGTLHLGT